MSFKLDISGWMAYHSLCLRCDMGEITVFVALAAGFLSFFTPCVLPLVPVYLASLSGPEIFEPEVKRIRFTLFFHSLSFVIGFSLVFALLGAGAGLIGFTFGAYYDIIRWIAGSLLVVFGLVLLVAFKVPWLNFERRLTPSL